MLPSAIALHAATYTVTVASIHPNMTESIVVTWAMDVSAMQNDFFSVYPNPFRNIISAEAKGAL